VNARDRAIADVRQSLADGSAKRRREATGVSQGRFAKAMGVGQSAVSMIESGRRVPTDDHVLAYGKALAAAEARKARRAA
jgi:transcriptional regulator with XRE-family HTH domain